MSRFSRLASSSSSSSDDDKDEELFIALQQTHSQYQAMQVPRWGGSVPRRQYVHRDREARHWRLYNDYFSDAPTYGANFFRRRSLDLACFFGLAGSHNDINVLHRSHLFAKLAEGEAPQVNYTVNGHNYTIGYYLADDIYPQWATFVKTIPQPLGNKRKYFAKAQEAVRKDVERAFGVLQSRFAIVRGPAQFWDKDTLRQIMIACVIMHNMIVEDERDEDEQMQYEYAGQLVRPTPREVRNRTPELHDFLQAHNNIRNRETHSQLQEDLVEHLWQRHADMY
ncbi:uncharacterized protein LOC133889569 [Phragmites australis]|uniref:uncharacterized protein LOC133889569 n=1 Tax=Phragmites australis TaxID=29695 RepID=UPI002D79B625|nr:uncharacterized protein LOC133889569 [Phragmites australis]